MAEPALAGAGGTGLAWPWLSYFGQDGTGVAEVIFGEYSPSGRLPFTVPTGPAQLGDIAEYVCAAAAGPAGTGPAGNDILVGKQ